MKTNSKEFNIAYGIICALLFWRCLDGVISFWYLLVVIVSYFISTPLVYYYVTVRRNSTKIKIIICDTVEQAEAEYFRLSKEGCWEMVDRLKIVWSWKKRKYVARFSMRKVNKPYRYEDYLSDVLKGINTGADYYRAAKKKSSK